MKLKINQPDYDRLRTLIVLVCNTPPRTGLDNTLLLYREVAVSRPELGIKDPAKRCRWDCYSAACKVDKALQNHLYAYLNDNHIDSALRHIFEAS